MYKDSGNNVSLYIAVSQVKDDGLVPWKEQLLSLKSQVNENERLAYYLGQLAQKYDHRISRCGTLLQGASIGYQMVSTLSRLRLNPCACNSDRPDTI
jgi:hypothetical protein